MFESQSIERNPIPPDELRVLADLTVELVKLRQLECKHLCVENAGPEIWKKLLEATYPTLTICGPDSAPAPRSEKP